MSKQQEILVGVRMLNDSLYLHMLYWKKEKYSCHLVYKIKKTLEVFYTHIQKVFSTNEG